jgi:hypothetical protein
MQVEDKGDDKITVTVKGTSKSEKSIIYLLAHTRQQVKLVFGKEINQGKAEWTVDKKLLGEGVSNFILIDANRQPLCERLYFKKPEHKMVVEMVAGIEYEKRTKVDLSISAHDETNRPLQADFSLAVCLIDSVQPLANAGIQSYVWLSSDLNGPVESPEYYFQQKQDDVLREATDNLMLTHGWRRFRWEEIASAQKPVFEFLPEYEGLLAQAKVVDKTSGEPIAGAIKGGIASFLLNGVYGANELVLQTDSNFNRYRVDLLSPFSENKGALFFPQFYLSTGAKDQLTAHHVNIQISNLFKTAASRRFVLPGEIDTAAFYGKPDKTYVLDEFTRFPTMEEVMREFVTGVRVRKEKERFTWEVMNTPYKLFFNNNPLVLLDGVPVFDVNKIMAFDPLKIKRIDVVAHKHFWGNVVANGIVSFSSYDGDLAGFELDPAAVVLEFQGLQLKREFYSPEYSTSEKQSNRLPDLRNVLYWNPDVQTNRDGKTHLEFYTSDIPGTYAVIVQGLDENGLPGNSIQLFRVSK